MPFSTKIEQEYRELVDAEIERITFENVSDFALFTEAWNTSQALKYQDDISGLRELIDSFDFNATDNIVDLVNGAKVGKKWVRFPAFISVREPVVKEKTSRGIKFLPEDRIPKEERVIEAKEEYKRIIREQIEARMRKFSEMSEAQKNQYITDQRNHRQVAANNQRIMAPHLLPTGQPTGEARTDDYDSDYESDEDYDDDDYDDDENITPPSTPTEAPIDPELLNSINSLISENLITENSPLMYYLYNNLITPEEIRQLSPLTPEKIAIVERYGNSYLTSQIITVAQAITLPAREIDILLCCNHICDLIKIGKMQIEEIRTLTDSQVLIFENSLVDVLIEKDKMTVLEAKALTSNDLIILDNPKIFINIIENRQTLAETLSEFRATLQDIGPQLIRLADIRNNLLPHWATYTFSNYIPLKSDLLSELEKYIKSYTDSILLEKHKTDEYFGKLYLCCARNAIIFGATPEETSHTLFSRAPTISVIEKLGKLLDGQKAAWQAKVERSIHGVQENKEEHEGRIEELKEILSKVTQIESIERILNDKQHYEEVKNILSTQVDTKPLPRSK